MYVIDRNSSVGHMITFFYDMTSAGANSSAGKSPCRRATRILPLRGMSGFEDRYQWRICAGSVCRPVPNNPGMGVTLLPAGLAPSAVRI